MDLPTVQLKDREWLWKKPLDCAHNLWAHGFRAGDACPGCGRTLQDFKPWGIALTPVVTCRMLDSDGRIRNAAFAGMERSLNGKYYVRYDCALSQYYAVELDEHLELSGLEKDMDGDVWTSWWVHPTTDAGFFGLADGETRRCWLSHGVKHIADAMYNPSSVPCGPQRICQGWGMASGGFKPGKSIADAKLVGAAADPGATGASGAGPIYSLKGLVVNFYEEADDIASGAY